MRRLAKPHPSQPNFSWDEPSPALEAKKRMIRLPFDTSIPEDGQVLFVTDELWVPISVVNGNIHILPGVPRLFTGLLDGLKPLLLPRLTDPEGKGVYRLLISTPMAESAVAEYLTELAAKVESRGIKVGSYPRWGRKRNTVTLVGRDKQFMERQGIIISSVDDCSLTSLLVSYPRWNATFRDAGWTTNQTRTQAAKQSDDLNHPTRHDAVWTS